MAAFPTRLNAPLLWERPVCDCHWYYQFYLCGCPDRTVPVSGDRGKHVPSFQGCQMWHKPYWEKAMADRYGFEHNKNPPVRNYPSVLPFPCYRHLMESRVFLPPAALRKTRGRFMDPKWNPASAARRNLNTHKVQLFQKQGRTWEGKKRAREEDDDTIPQRPARRRRGSPESEDMAEFRRRLHDLELQDIVDDYRRRLEGLQNAASDLNQQNPTGTLALPSFSPSSSSTSLPSDLSSSSGPSSVSLAYPYATYSESTASEGSPPPTPPSQNSHFLPLPQPFHLRPTPLAGWPGSPDRQPSTPLPLSPTTSTISSLSSTSTSSTHSSLSSPSSSPTSTITLPPTATNHFTSLTWLLEEQRVDLWALDGYRHRCPPPRPSRPAPPTPPSLHHHPSLPPSGPGPLLLSIEQQHQNQQKEKEKQKRGGRGEKESDGIVRHHVPHDGNTHQGYHAGAYKVDEGVLLQARVANWWGVDPEGRWAMAVGEWFARGGGWFGPEGAGLSME